jgi:hypothetical protein
MCGSRYTCDIALSSFGDIAENLVANRYGSGIAGHNSVLFPEITGDKMLRAAYLRKNGRGWLPAN